MRSLVILTLALVACETESPEYAFREIKSAACAGDINGFFSRVDWNSVQSDILRTANTKSNPLVEVAGRAAFAQVRSQFEDDIRLGSASRWCQAEKLDYSAELSIVFFRINGGETLLGTFTNSGGKYVLSKISKD